MKGVLKEELSHPILKSTLSLENPNSLPGNFQPEHVHSICDRIFLLKHGLFVIYGFTAQISLNQIMKVCFYHDLKIYDKVYKSIAESKRYMKGYKDEEKDVDLRTKPKLIF